MNSIHPPHLTVFGELSLPHTTLLGFYLFVYALFIANLTPNSVSIFSLNLSRRVHHFSFAVANYGCGALPFHEHGEDDHVKLTYY